MRKIICILICIFYITQSCTNQNSSLNQGGTPLKHYFVEIPYESFRGLIIIKAEVNGEQHRFILDTGSPTCIFENLAQTLALENASPGLVVDSNNKRDSLDHTILDKITIGGIPFEQIPILIVPDSLELFNCLNVDGFIGSNLLRNSIVKISSQTKLVTITDSRKYLDLTKQHSQELLFKSKQGTPVFSVLFGGEELGDAELAFDSGYDGLLALSLRNYDQIKHDDVFSQADSTRGSTSIGIFGFARDTMIYKLILPRLIFNSMELDNVSVRTSSSENSRFGLKILDYADVTIDYINNRIYFTPIADDKIEVKIAEYPINATFIEGKLAIGAIWGSSRFPEVSLGDEIISFDNVDCQELSLCELLLLSDSMLSEKDSMEIVTKDKEGKIHSTWMKKE